MTFERTDAFTQFDVSLQLQENTWQPLVETPKAPPTLEQIRALQAHLSQFPQVELEPKHFFAPGMYGRELAIPGGCYIVGKMHRHAHLIQLLSGECQLATESGSETIKGPRMWVSRAGDKRAIRTVTDCVFVTFHAIEGEDLTKIEEELIIPEPMMALDSDKKQLGEFTDELQGMYA